MVSLISRHTARQGIAVFSIVAMVVLSVLVVTLFSQGYLSQVNSQRETVFAGREAFYLAESAINEAFLDFKAGMNTPSASLNDWYELLRDDLESDGLIESSFYPFFTDESCAASGVSIEDVQVYVWGMKPVNGNRYDRCGLLTINAEVAIRRKSSGLFNRYIYRNFQKSWQIRQTDLGHPSPFHQWSLFILQWDYLQRAKDGYESEQSSFSQRREEAQAAMEAYMDTIPVFLEPKIDQAIWALDKLEEVKDFVDGFEIDLGVTTVGASSVGWGPDDVQAGVDNALALYNLTMDDAQNIADTDPLSWIPDYDLKSVDWPPFRSDSTSLSSPVVSTKSPLTATDFILRFPQWPSLPSEPVISADWIHDWDFPQLSYLKNIFTTWKSSYDSTVPGPYEEQWTTELRRHENIFQLLSSIPDSYESLHKEYQYRRCSWRFKTQSEFLSWVTRTGGLTFDGGYWVKGGVSLSGSSKGSGFVASDGDVTVNNLGIPDSDLMAIYSKGSIDVSGNLNASLITPQGTVRLNGGTVRGSIVENYHNGDEGFSLETNPQAVTDDPAQRVWFTVSPYPEASSLIRNGR